MTPITRLATQELFAPAAKVMQRPHGLLTLGVSLFEITIPVPAKDRCYRFTAPADPVQQSYFVDVPWNAETYSCQWFWEVER